MTVTTNNASVVAANELDRITNVLSSYDVSPKLDGDGWLPGDPLWKRPRKGAPGQQWTRPMFELHENDFAHDRLALYDEELDEHYLAPWEATCPTCEVSWEGAAPCWMCGARRGRPPAQRVVLTGQTRVMFVPHVNDLCAPSVAEIASAEPVPGLVPTLARREDRGDERVFYYSTTAEAPWEDFAPIELRVLEWLHSDDNHWQLDGFQRHFVNQWFAGARRDRCWETVTGGVTYDDLRPGVPKVTIEIRYNGDTIGSAFYLDDRGDFQLAMRRAVKAIDMQMGYSAGGRRAGA